MYFRRERITSIVAASIKKVLNTRHKPMRIFAKAEIDKQCTAFPSLQFQFILFECLT